MAKSTGSNDPGKPGALRASFHMLPECRPRIRYAIIMQKNKFGIGMLLHLTPKHLFSLTGQRDAAWAGAS